MKKRASRTFNSAGGDARPRRYRHSIAESVPFNDGRLLRLQEYLQEREDVLLRQAMQGEPGPQAACTAARLAEVQCSLIWLVTNLDENKQREEHG